MGKPAEIKPLPVPKLLAVYGTLKRGKRNNQILVNAGFTFQGSTYTKDADFILEGGNGYPIMRVGGQCHVLCDLFSFKDFNQLKNVDTLEGIPHFYERVLVDMNTGVRAWMYVQGEPKKGAKVSRTRVTRMGPAVGGVESWA